VAADSTAVAVAAVITVNRNLRIIPAS
jgi:hypothetical protein